MGIDSRQQQRWRKTFNARGAVPPSVLLQTETETLHSFPSTSLLAPYLQNGQKNARKEYHKYSLCRSRTTMGANYGGGNGNAAN